MNKPADVPALLSHRVKRLAHVDIPGGGQVMVQGNYAYVGHMLPPYGTTIFDISDPRNPRIVSQIKLEDDYSHTHKARIVGDLMYTNVEQNNRRLVRKAKTIPKLREQLAAELKRPANDAEVAQRMEMSVEDLQALEKFAARPYTEGGFKIWDVKDRSKPRLITHQRTGGVGVHRFDVDENYAYISSEMEGYVGNILIIYDVRDPAKVKEVSRWWMPGQHIAGGEKPTWEGAEWRLHHAMRVGDKLWAGCWQGGVRVIDIADITRPKTIGAYNYHPPFHEPTHTFLPVPFKIGGRDIAVGVDEQHDHHPRGQPRAGLWLFDVTDLSNIHPVGQYNLSELDSPYVRMKGRFGAHQFQEHIDDTLVYCTWFSGGLRIIDISNPGLPEEVGWYIPDPCGGYPTPQSNDVDTDKRGLIYLLDRNFGFDILEFER